MGCVCCRKKPTSPYDVKVKDQSKENDIQPGTNNTETTDDESFDRLSWVGTSSDSYDSDLGSECLSIADMTSSDNDSVIDMYAKSRDTSEIIRSISPEVPYCKSRLDHRKCSVDETNSDSDDGDRNDTKSGPMVSWKKGNKIGRGQYGTVWCGLTSEGELIAVKEVTLSTLNNDAAENEYSRIYKEVSLIRKLQHKNIVRYIGSNYQNGVIRIFMQFVPGGSLRDVLCKFGPLEEQVAANYTRQLLHALQYIHEKNIIHRDIKCANVVLMPDGVIKLIDFGCAKQIPKRLLSGNSTKKMDKNRESSKKLGGNRKSSKRNIKPKSREKPQNLQNSLRGTPYWMSPEVVMQTGHDKTADIWSLGCSVIEMLTGDPPWSDRDPIAAMYAIGNGIEMPVLPVQHSKDAKDFISRCLNRNKNQRPSANVLLLHNFVKESQIHRRQTFH